MLKKPLPPLIVDNGDDLIVQLVDFYRCLDTIDYDGDETDEVDDEDLEGQYTKERQRELARTHNMLIKAFGILESGHSITINLQGFQPFFYLKVPDDWDITQCRHLIQFLKDKVYRCYQKHLVKYELLHRKPFTEFTGDDQFNFLKLQFINKEAYDCYAYKLMEPLRIPGLNHGHPYQYALYESNIEPILKMIHMTKINPSGWIKLPRHKYVILKETTSLSDLEVKIKWDQIQPHDKLENAAINFVAFDIEADSSHGDFPIGIKNYQKLAQELVTLYNEVGLQTHKSHAHHLFQHHPKQVIHSLLQLVFDDDYVANGIHQIRTVSNLKPHCSTIDQLQSAIYQLITDKIQDSEGMIRQLTDFFECNLPAIDLDCQYNSHYELLAREVISQLQQLSKNNIKRFREQPLMVIGRLLRLAFEDYFDNFQVSNIYTKNNIKPDSKVIEAIVPDVLHILHDCATFTHLKIKPEGLSPEESDNLSQDYFVHRLTNLFGQYFPPVEGDRLIQIGSTFQLTNQSDCYLKHIMCLDTCDSITNEEMILFENKDIYLPAEDLAKDLVMYELQLTNPPGSLQDPPKDKVEEAIKTKLMEIKTWDVGYRQIQCQKAAEYRRRKQSTTDHARVVVEFYDNERDLLLAWQRLITTNDPDLVIGYNIFGFDFKFLYDRAIELSCVNEFCQLGRLKGFIEPLYEQKLSSAGLGDNTLKYLPMTGRVVIDLYKVIQKDYRLDSYKLDRVCHKFLYKEKVDMPPRDIFSLQKGTSVDRKKIAVYCLVDCILCNRLVLKLDIIANNIAMANVCKVPFPYLFLRGQGVKIFSLVADYCAQNNYLIPVLPKADLTNDEKYEGAIVLVPDKGIHFEPVGVGDFNSLYPSSMISENISHDSFVQIGGKYDNLPGYTYRDIQYDVFQTEIKTNTKQGKNGKNLTRGKPGSGKKIKKKVGTQTCRYAQLPGDKKSVIPSILRRLLDARKMAKNKMEEEKDPFKAKLWNGLQLAYKITANSLYGQCGAKTSPIYKVEIAASTTAVGRRMILFSKNHIETKYKNQLVTLDLNCSGIFNPKTKQMEPTKYTGMQVLVKDSYCVYGDTDSVFIKFGLFTPSGQPIEGLDAVSVTIALTKRATKEISGLLTRPQNIEFEKAIWPFILISKKRYHGHYYTKIANPNFYENSMGIALKRRDNAPIVKYIFGGAVNIIMKDHDVAKAQKFVFDECHKLLKGDFPLDQFIISKTLKSYYKKPRQIAHNVLACRQAQRDPGNRFEPNDRVPYAFIINPSKEALQGDRIETPDFIQQNKLRLDYQMYITNQIMKPVSQIFELVKGYEKMEQQMMTMMGIYESERTGNISLMKFFGPEAGMGTKLNSRQITKLSDLIKQRKIPQPEETEETDDEIEENESDVEVESTSNYDNPHF